MQPPGGQHATHGAAQVALPRDPGVARQHAPQDAAVDEEHHDADADLGEAAGVEAADQQVGEPAEHDAAGAEGDGARRREEPDREPRRHDDHERRPRPPPPAVEQHQGAEQEERDRVADQVRPAPVQPRRQEDADQSLVGVRPDAVGIERVVLTWSTASSTHMPISRAPIATIAVADPDPAHGPPRLQRAHASKCAGCAQMGAAASDAPRGRPPRLTAPVSSSERRSSVGRDHPRRSRWSRRRADCPAALRQRAEPGAIGLESARRPGSRRSRAHAERSDVRPLPLVGPRAVAAGSRRQGTAPLAFGGLDTEPLAVGRGGFGADAASRAALRQRAVPGCTRCVPATAPLPVVEQRGSPGRRSHPQDSEPCGIRGFDAGRLSVVPA